MLRFDFFISFIKGLAHFLLVTKYNMKIEREHSGNRKLFDTEKKKKKRSLRHVKVNNTMMMLI